VPSGSAGRAVKQREYGAADRFGQVRPRIDDAPHLGIGWSLCNPECNVIRRFTVSVVLIVLVFGAGPAVNRFVAGSAPGARRSTGWCVVECCCGYSEGSSPAPARPRAKAASASKVPSALTLAGSLPARCSLCPGARSRPAG